MDHEQACRIFASCCNRLDARELIGALHEDIRFESQRSLLPILGKKEVSKWLRKSMKVTGCQETLQTLGVLHAELAVTQEYPMYQISPRLCVALDYTLDLEFKCSSTVLFNIKEDKISEIDLCTIPPTHTLRRLGTFPGGKPGRDEKGATGA